MRSKPGRDGSVQDARGNVMPSGVLPERIISLVPSLTELLVDLGLEDRLAGVTRFCIHPSDIKHKKTIVGGTKNVNIERIRALDPDLVIANIEENTLKDVEALEDFCPVFVTDVRTVAGATPLIRRIGRLTGTEDAADALAADVEEKFDRMPAFEAVPTLYLIWRRPYMSIGRDTFIHDMMARIGLQNVCGNETRYPALSERDMAERSPRVALLSSEPFPFRESHVPEISTILPSAIVRLADGGIFSWYGSRMRLAPDYLLGLRKSIDHLLS